MKLLLHTCCAPCSVYCIEELRSENVEPVLFWYNPNIHPFAEYKNRLETLKEYSQRINAELIIDDFYGLDEFVEKVGCSRESRCVSYCYPVRLKRTFEYAKEHGFDAVSTTLLYSIYQNHDFIKSYCEKLSVEYGIEFLYRDFRVGFWKGHDSAIENGLYMQKYCGCIFSEEDRFLYNKKTVPFLPEGFVFPERTALNLKRISAGKNEDRYLLIKGEEEICSAIIVKTDDKTAEIKDLSVFEKYANKNYEQRLIKNLCGTLKQKYGKITVSPEPEQIPFFVKLGFDGYEEMSSDGKIVLSVNLTDGTV